MKILASTIYDKNEAHVVQFVSGSTSDEVRRFLRFWRNHHSVIGFNVRNRNERDATFDVSFKSAPAPVTKIVLDGGGFFLTPVPVSNGLESWSIVLLEDKKKPSLLSELDRIGVVKVNMSKRIESQEIVTARSPIHFGLSPKQTTVLKAAFERGYFESPRKIRSRELAMQLGIAQSTLLEHLRKAQSKLIRQALHHL